LRLLPKQDCQIGTDEMYRVRPDGTKSCKRGKRFAVFHETEIRIEKKPLENPTSHKPKKKDDISLDNVKRHKEDNCQRELSMTFPWSLVVVREGELTFPFGQKKLQEARRAS
jgi:hypothetical protein